MKSLIHGNCNLLIITSEVSIENCAITLCFTAFLSAKLLSWIVCFSPIVDPPLMPVGTLCSLLRQIDFPSKGLSLTLVRALIWVFVEPQFFPWLEFPCFLAMEAVFVYAELRSSLVFQESFPNFGTKKSASFTAVCFQWRISLHLWGRWTLGFYTPHIY